MARTTTIMVMAVLLLVVTFLTAPLTAVPYRFTSGTKGLHIVASFPNIAKDVELLAAPDDQVEYIAPPGVDPHTYSLTTSDLDKLRNADIIVSTAHTGFERGIRERVNNGELKGVLIEIPSIPGIRIAENPVTGRPNYHMPIYDPYNYILFIKYLRDIMSNLRPSMKQYYYERADTVIESVMEIINATPRLNVSVVAEKPYMQYALEWTGARIEYLLVKEEGASPTPVDIAEIEDAMKTHRVGLVAVTEPAKTTTASKLIDLAEKYNVPIIYVPAPARPESMLDKIGRVSEQLRGLVVVGGGGGGEPPGSHGILETITQITAIITLIATIAYIGVGRNEK